MTDMINTLTRRRDSLKQELVRMAEAVVKKNAEIEELNESMRKIRDAIQFIEDTIEEMRQKDQQTD